MFGQLAQVIRNLGGLHMVLPWSLHCGGCSTAMVYWLPRSPAPLFGVIVAC